MTGKTLLSIEDFQPGQTAIAVIIRGDAIGHDDLETMSWGQSTTR